MCFWLKCMKWNNILCKKINVNYCRDGVQHSALFAFHVLVVFHSQRKLDLTEGQSFQCNSGSILMKFSSLLASGLGSPLFQLSKSQLSPLDHCHCPSTLLPPIQRPFPIDSFVRIFSKNCLIFQLETAARSPFLNSFLQYSLAADP